MRPKRSLGQNFLTNPHVVNKIIEFADVGQRDCVLEIGPGRGIMTTALARVAARVVAVEKDDDLAETLAAEYAHDPRIRIVHGDILELNLETLAPAGAKLVANLPYNIATAVILRLVELPKHFTSVTVMVQKEVALRICADKGTRDYAGLSVLVGVNFTTVPGFLVGPGNFSPRPKIDSMVIKLIGREETMAPDDLRHLKTVVFGAFGQRRKMLRNSWINLPGMSGELLNKLALEAGIDLGRRPQDLTIEDFKRFSRLYRSMEQCDAAP
ncbi:MAG: 16S rRNA (adenine(1518)-N(6)/adenine(1519)-N(6))-dimethyltransferase RsmA [Syntrophaceae bacterium]